MFIMFLDFASWWCPYINHKIMAQKPYFQLLLSVPVDCPNLAHHSLLKL